MSAPSTLVLISTVLLSVFLVSIIILLGWYLIWKTFLSKFRLVRELLGQTNVEGTPHKSTESTAATSGFVQTHNKIKKTKRLTATENFSNFPQ